MRACRIRARNNSAIDDRIRIPRSRRRDVLRAARGRSGLNGQLVPALDHVEDALLLLAEVREARHALALDHRLLAGRVVQAEEDGAAVAHG